MLHGYPKRCVITIPLVFFVMDSSNLLTSIVKCSSSTSTYFGFKLINIKTGKATSKGPMTKKNALAQKRIILKNEK